MKRYAAFAIYMKPKCKIMPARLPDSYINIHTHQLIPATDEIAVFNVDIRNMPPLERSPFYSIGLHPWHILSDNTAYMEYVASHAGKKNILAIGETGIDRNSAVAVSRQEEIFIQHIHIAEMAGKPVIIHCVRAFYEIIALYKKLMPSVPFIFHGYNSNLAIARQLLAIEGFYLSFGAALKHPHSNASKVIREIPMDRFFLETDDHNVPIAAIFTYAATYKYCTLAALQRQLAINFKRIF
jgi:TatD DNase family protein